MSSSDSDDRYAPLSGRVRILALSRLVVAASFFVTILPSIGSLVDEPAATGRLTLIEYYGGATVAYIVINLGIYLVLRARPSSARLVLNLSLMVDAVWTIAIMFVTGGVLSPYVFLGFVQVIAATVLFSWQTGIKTSLALTVGMLALAAQVQTGPGSADRIITIPIGGTNVEVTALGDIRTTIVFSTIFVIVSLWVVTWATAYFSNVNERELRRSNQELSVLRELNTHLERSLDLADVCQAIAQGVVGDLGYKRAVVWMAHGGEELQPAGAHGFEAEALDLLSGLRLTSGSGPVEKSLGSRRSVLISREDARPAPLADAFSIDSPLILVPLTTEVRTLGLLTVELTNPIGRSPVVRGRDLRILSTLATEASLALENARLHQELRDLSITDALTGLYNHRYFQQRLQEELDRSIRRANDGAVQPVSLILMDIDYFKKVNDRFGHPSGDELLRSMSKLAVRVLRSADVVCRYGGEEFVVILPDTSQVEGAMAAERIREAIERSSFTGSEARTLGQVTASFGLATYSEGIPSRSELIRLSDEALYEAKEGGRNRVVVSAGQPVISARRPAVASTWESVEPASPPANSGTLQVAAGSVGDRDPA